MLREPFFCAHLHALSIALIAISTLNNTSRLTQTQEFMVHPFSSVQRNVQTSFVSSSSVAWKESKVCLNVKGAKDRKINWLRFRESCNGSHDKYVRKISQNLASAPAAEYSDHQWLLFPQVSTTTILAWDAAASCSTNHWPEQFVKCWYGTFAFSVIKTYSEIRMPNITFFVVLASILFTRLAFRHSLKVVIESFMWETRFSVFVRDSHLQMFQRSFLSNIM